MQSEPIQLGWERATLTGTGYCQDYSKSSHHQGQRQYLLGHSQDIGANHL
jgi:hypothetical protein